MGNECSSLEGLQLSEQAADVTSDWAFYTGKDEDGKNVSVFVSHRERKGKGIQLLEKAIKNFKIYRHPCILHYISSSSNGYDSYLVTESVLPLSTVLKQQSPLQICLGLYAILKALVFFHEKANCSHNNVCRAAIYVMPNGSWKLGGLEFLCRFSEVTSEHLESTRARRYDRGIPPEEEGSGIQTAAKDGSRDAFAFGVLLEELLTNQEEGQLPGTEDLLTVAKKELQSNIPSCRPLLSSLLTHHFFSLDFIAISNFLKELPIKTDAEKAEFFRSLIGRLVSLPEEMVAAQLGELLLGRMVLLDSTARADLLPHLLTPRGTGNATSKSNSLITPLFSVDTFRQHLLPSLLKIFHVRDAQIRLALLKHFSSFCSIFPREQLQTELLPQVLLGIKDTNNELVSASLRALADLVPLLGAAKVVGGQRGKLFIDGKPKAAAQIDSRSPEKRQADRIRRKEERKLLLEEKKKQREMLKAMSEARTDTEEIGKGALEKAEADSGSPTRANLSERHPPDGGESGESECGCDDGTESWSEWEDPAGEVLPTDVSMALKNDLPEATPVLSKMQLTSQKSRPDSQKAKPLAPLVDIMKLDIKVLKISGGREEVEEDYFADMEPVISKPKQDFEVRFPSQVAVKQNGSEVPDKFEVKTSEEAVEEGWGEDLNWEEDLEVK